MSWWIMDGITRFNHQSTLCPMIYLNHMAIARIKEFEFFTFLKCSSNPCVFWLWFMKTDEEWGLGRWMVKRVQLKNARIKGKLQLPLMSDTLHSENWPQFCFQMLQTDIIQDLHMKNSQRSCQNNEELVVNSRKKWMWNLENFERICEFFGWIWKNDYSFCDSVRIKALYQCVNPPLIMIRPNLKINEMELVMQFGFFALGWLGSM